MPSLDEAYYGDLEKPTIMGTPDYNKTTGRFPSAATPQYASSQHFSTSKMMQHGTRTVQTMPSLNELYDTENKPAATITSHQTIVNTQGG